MAANELEELVDELLRQAPLLVTNEERTAYQKRALSLIESEKVKAVEEYRKKLNAYWPEGSEEPTLSSEQVKTILDNVLKERN